MFKTYAIFDIIIITAEAIFVLLLFEQTFLLASILLALTVMCFRYLYTREDKVYYVVATIIGPLAEVAAIRRGAWTYSHFDFFLMPLWLPLAWGVVIVSIRRISTLVLQYLKSGIL